MGLSTSYGVQCFVMAKGKLGPGRFIDCKDASEAYQIAEERVRLGHVVGAAAFSRTVTDPEYDDGEEPVTLATFGRVPASVMDQIPF